MKTDDYLTLKWGTLKAWNLTSEKGKELLERYADIGSSASAMLQRDTPEQKDLICQMIDECGAETIYLDWDDKEVSKEEAKRYVMEYGAKHEPADSMAADHPRSDGRHPVSTQRPGCPALWPNSERRAPAYAEA